MGSPSSSTIKNLAAGDALIGALFRLREGDAVTREVFEARGASIVQAVQLDESKHDLVYDRFVSATKSMEGSLPGDALRAALGLDREDPSQALEKRRIDFASRTGIRAERCSDLEHRAIHELALRLLGKHYPLAPGGEEGLITGGFLIKEQKSTAIYKNCRLIGVRQVFDVIPIDESGDFVHSVSMGTRLVNLGNVEVRNVDVDDGQSLYTLRILSGIERGVAVKFQFAETGSSGAVGERVPRAESHAWTKPYAVLHYHPQVEFIGEAPRDASLFVDNVLVCKVRTQQKVVPDEARKLAEWIEAAPSEINVLVPRVSIEMKWRWSTPPKLRIIIAVLFMAISASDLPFLMGLGSDSQRNILVLVRVAFAVLTFREIYQYFWLRNRLDFRYSHDYSTLQQVPESAITSLQNRASDAKLCSKAQAVLFALGVTQSRLLRQRVVESYDLGQRAVHQRVSVDIEVPHKLIETISNGAGNDIESEKTIYFPVLMPLKSKFQDNFSVQGPDGTSLHVLPYREYLQLAAVVLRNLLVIASGGNTINSIPPHVKAAEKEALALLVSRREAGEVSADLLNSSWHESVHIPDDASAAQRSAMQWAIDFVDMLSGHYAIVVPLRVDGHGRGLVKYEQSLVPDLELTSRRRLAVMLGARPVDLSFSIRIASTCRSYHLRVNGTEGLYLGNQRLVDSSATLAAKARNEDVPAHFRFRRRLGQQYAHMYARLFPEPARLGGQDGVKGRFEFPTVRLQFFETPPGSLLRAVLSSLACLALVWIVGIVNSRVPDTGSDAPAFMLAFPAIVGAWLGFDSAGKRLLEGTLASRVSLVCTVLTSIMASALFIGHKGLEGTHHWYVIPQGWAVFWIHDWSWLFVFSVAMLNSFLVTVMYVRRVAYFSYLASRNQGEEIVSHG